jgi:hypothetical protein
MKRLLSVLAVISIGIGLVGGVWADDNPLKISGFVDVYANVNLNSPTSRSNPLHNFDLSERQISLNLTEVVFERKALPVGFRADFDFGPTTTWVHTIIDSDGDGVADSVDDTFEHLQQAYVSYVVPVGKGLTVDAGKFVTHQGSEVIETKDNWNYTRSLLFAWAIPYFHVGVRGNYPISDKLFINGYILNGINRIADNNSGKTFGAQVGLTPTAKLPILLNVIAGPEQNDNNSDWRFIFDAVATLNVNDKLSLMANFDYGVETLEPENAVWVGIAGYARYALANSWAIIPRGEWYKDRDGFTTGTAQNLIEGTLTLEKKIKDNLLTRIEGRLDISDEEVFEKDDPAEKSKSQFTILAGAVYSF